MGLRGGGRPASRSNISRITRIGTALKTGAGYASGGGKKAQPASPEITAAAGSLFSGHLTRLLGGQIANKWDLIAFVVVGLEHQENPVGEDCQRE